MLLQFFYAAINYTAEMSKVESLVTDLTAADDIIRSVNPWYPDLEVYFNENLGVADNGEQERRIAG